MVDNSYMHEAHTHGRAVTVQVDWVPSPSLGTHTIRNML